MSKNITSVTQKSNGTISRLHTAGGQSFTPHQAAKLIDNGETITFKGQTLQSVNGQYVHTPPDGKSGNNLVKR